MKNNLKRTLGIVLLVSLAITLSPMATRTLAERVERKDDPVTKNEALDHGESDAQETQAEKVHQIEGEGTPENEADDKWEIKSVEFEPPVEWSFKEFTEGSGEYVDIIPASIDNLAADADPESNSKIRVFWFSKNMPESADDFGLRAEGNLLPPSGNSGTDGSATKKHHWAAKIKTPSIDIDADINRDGDVTDEDEDGEESIGTIVVADKENVYDDSGEPARRREIVISRSDGGSANIRLARSSSRVKVYTAEADGSEVFGSNDEVAVAEGTYWLQGGSSPSPDTREDFLRIREDDDSADYVDAISITVIWASISGKNSGQISDDPVYDAVNEFKTITGHINLGVQTSIKGDDEENPSLDWLEHGGRSSSGIIEVRADLLPRDLLFDTPITSGFQYNETANIASASFGFVFRRIVNSKTYLHANTPAFASMADESDDSHNSWQDTDPDVDGSDLVIADVDGPNVNLSAGGGFMHRRMNFDEHVALYFNGDAERCSAVLPWAYTTDVALAPDGKLVYLFEAPNGANGANRVVVGDHLDDLDLSLPGKPQITSVQTSEGGGQIVLDEENIIEIEGTHLIGVATLLNLPKTAHVDITAVERNDNDNEVSDASKMIVSITPSSDDFDAGGGWELHVFNAEGSDSEEGFEFVE